MVNLAVHIAPFAQWQADAAVFFAFQKRGQELPGLARWLAAQAPELAGSAGLADFGAEAGQTAVIYAPGRSVPRLILAGLGEGEGFGPERLRTAAAAAAQKARELKLARLGWPLAAFEGLTLPSAAAAEESLTAALLGLYEYTALKTAPREPEQPEAILLLAESPLSEELEQAAASARAAAAGIYLARDLVNAPANLATPSFLAKAALELAERHGFQAEVLEPEQIRELHMEAFLAVAKGSAEPARLVVIDTRPQAADESPLVFVGKGVTFDTGGISLKPPAGMEKMKGDMAGAAAVLGLLEAAGLSGLSRRIVAVLPLAENMPGGHATKPGDVVTTALGKTVEIVNTDAEGRLLLCDALSYAGSFKPALLVDIATLTGACVVALGPQVAGAFANRPGLAEAVRTLGETVGERFWPLPLWDLYFEALKSDVADMKNVGPREGGAVNAALFLKQFVPDGVAWVHLDIAGPGFADKKAGYVPAGGTGFAVRTLLAMVRNEPALSAQDACPPAAI